MVGHGPCVQTMDSFSRNKRPARDWGTAGSDYGRLYYQRALHLRHGDFMAPEATEIMRRRCCAGSTCSLRIDKLGAGDRPSRDVIAGLSRCLSLNLAPIPLNHSSDNFCIRSAAPSGISS